MLALRRAEADMVIFGFEPLDAVLVSGRRGFLRIDFGSLEVVLVFSATVENLTLWSSTGACLRTLGVGRADVDLRFMVECVYLYWLVGRLVGW